MLALLLFFMPLWGVYSNEVHESYSAPLGGSILFQIQPMTNTELNSIFWSFTRNGEKKMLAIAKPDSFKIIDDSIKERATWKGPELALTLRDLTQEDSGTYRAEIYSTGSTRHIYFHLDVIGNSQHKGVYSNEVHQSLSAPLGGSVLFQIQPMTNTELNSISWTFTRSDEKKMLAIAKPDSFKIIDDSIKNRATWKWPELALTLRDLTQEDSGTYRAEIYSTGSTRHIYFHLDVIGNSQHKDVSPSGGAPRRWNNIHITACGILLAFIISET